MQFYKISNKIRYPEILNFKNYKDFLEDLYFIFEKKNVENLKFKDEILSFTTRESLFYIRYFIKIFCRKKEIIYEIEIINLIKLIVILVLIGFFFTNFTFGNFFLYSFIFFFLFFYLNIIIISSLVSREIKKIFLILEEENLKNSMEYFKNKNMCPACGAEINKYYFKCLECGLHLKNKQIINHTNLSNFESSKIEYYFVKKNDKK